MHKNKIKNSSCYSRKRKLHTYKYTKKGEKNELYTTTNDTKIYQKNEILVLIYKYNNFQEVKNKIINNYKEELKNTLPIELTQEENYIQKKRCDDEFCSYELGYKKIFNNM